MNYNKTGVGRIPIVPSRKAASPASRSGSDYSPIGQRIGDCFFTAINSIHQIYLQKLDERFPNRTSDASASREHANKSSECKNIRNQARNDVLQSVLPLYTVTPRVTGVADTAADLDARAIIIDNVFNYAVKTFLAWTDEFVPAEQVDTVEQLVMKVALVQREKLERELQNFTFQFRKVVPPNARR